MEGPRRGGASSKPLFGRSELLAEIDRALERARSGHGQALLVTGPGGIGKTEALRAATERAHGWRVARGRALPDDLPVPFSLVRDLIRALGGGADTPSETDLPPSIALPILLETADSPRPGPRASEEEPPEGGTPDAELERILAPLGKTSVEGLGAIRYRLYSRLTEYFLKLAEDRPLLLAIDDLQFADPSSLHFLELLSPELPSARVLLVATVGESADLPARSREILDRIARSPPFRVVGLRPLSLAELGEFVAWLQAGAHLETDELLRWQAQTNGNPLLVEQLARSSAGPGPSYRSPSGSEPGGLVDTLLHRSRSLPDLDQRVLTYATVLGREFDFPKLAAVVGVGEERVTEVLDRLVRAGLLRERGGEVYEFVSEAVRGGLYAGLTETRRRILHRKVAAALEKHGGTSDFELSRQFFLGREDGKSVEYNVRAAEAATRAFAFDAAVSHLARALESERRRPDRDRRREVRLLTEEGRLLGETGDLKRSEEVLLEAVGLARQEPQTPLDLGKAVLALAWARAERSDYPTAEPLASEAYRLLEQGGTARDRMAAHRGLGTIYWRTGDFARAETHQRAALAIAEKEGTPLELGHALVDVANVVGGNPIHLDAALAYYQRAADLFATADDPNARSRVLMNRAVFEYAAGRVEPAFRDLAVALESAERSRSPIWIGYCLLNLAQWEAERDAPKPARAALDRAASVLDPLGDRLAAQQIAMIRGMIAEIGASWDEAERRYQESLAIAREMQMSGELAEILFRLARLSWRRRELDEARARLSEARAARVLELRPEFTARMQALDASLTSS